ncbi:Uncharacterised protein [Klebsiella pneumoniae]|nr:Uncharacterised protein [Klebsiella pneumoniae]
MSGLINPHAAPEEAAYALLIELVRAQRVPQYEGEISGLLAMYDKPLNTLKRRDRALADMWCEKSVTPAEAGRRWLDAAWVISCRGR